MGDWTIRFFSYVTVFDSQRRCDSGGKYGDIQTGLCSHLVFLSGKIGWKSRCRNDIRPRRNHRYIGQIGDTFPYQFQPVREGKQGSIFTYHKDDDSAAFGG